VTLVAVMKAAMSVSRPSHQDIDRGGRRALRHAADEPVDGVLVEAWSPQLVPPAMATVGVALAERRQPARTDAQVEEQGGGLGSR